MLYSNYEKKVEKVQKILKIMYKFRYLIISVIGVLFITSIILTCLKGTFSSDLTLSSKEITYGQEYSYETSARMSDLWYEFYYENEGWQEEKPYLVGDYKIRAVTKRAFGGKNYSEEVAFAIVPLKVELIANEESLVYGKTPTFSAPLVYEDRINSFDFEFSSVDVGEERIVKAKDVCVVDKWENDVSYCYTFNCIDNAIKITKKKVDITFYGDSKVYDGTALSCKKYLAEGLEYGDELVILKAPKILNAGSIKNEVEYDIVNKDGISVKENYEPNVKAEELTVTQREIAVKPRNESKVYDGKPFTAITCEVVEGELLAGHYLTDYVFSGEIINCGTIETEILSLIILDANENKVTDNYLISYEKGSLEITPCEITIKATANKVYNGSFIVDKESVTLKIVRYDGSIGLFDNHTIEYEFVENALALNVGKYELLIQEYPTIYFNGKDISGNYDMILEVGSLEIIRCDITIKPDAVKVYDDSSVVDKKDVTLEIVRYDGSIGIFENHTIEYELKENPSAINVGTYDLFIEGFPSIVYNGDDVSQNFNIEVLKGLLTIEKRPVKVVTSSAKKEYDRTALSCDSQEILEGSLVDTHKFKRRTSLPTITRVGEIANEFILDIVNSKGVSVKSNYDLDQTFGTLTITKRKLKIELYDVEKTYDGKPAQMEKRYWMLENKLLPGDTIKNIVGHIVQDENGVQIELDDIINAGEYTVSAECEISYAYSYTDYYDIEVVGIIKVLKAELKIVSASAKKKFDGEELSNPQTDITFGELAKGESLFVGVSGCQIAVGTSTNTIDFIIINGEEKYINGDGIYEFSNYLVTVKQGVLTVTK